MDGKFEESFKTIRALLIVLIITTAVTAGLVAVVMIQWAPVASYYREGIAEEAAYEEEYGDEELYTDESGEVLEEGEYLDENGEPISEEDVLTDEEGSPLEEDASATDEESDADAATSEGAAQ
jgi:hypothetical protein